jgi:uncharacterized protein YdcH (DUF465 family)
MMKQVLSSRGIEFGADRLSQVEARHRALDARLKDLARHAYLTPIEQLEIAELKKQKLKAKDEIFELRRAMG